MENKKPIFIETKIRIDANPLGLAPGTMVDMRVEIFDEFATIRTSNCRFTRDLARSTNPGEIAKYSDRLQKTIIKYPGKSQAEIAKIISADIKKLTK